MSCGPTHGSLVSYQSVFAENENRNAVEFSHDLACQSLFSRYTGDAGQQINSVRRTTQLNQLLGFGEV